MTVGKIGIFNGDEMMIMIVIIIIIMIIMKTWMKKKLSGFLFFDWFAGGKIMLCDENIKGIVDGGKITRLAEEERKKRGKI